MEIFGNSNLAYSNSDPHAPLIGTGFADLQMSNDTEQVEM